MKTAEMTIETEEKTLLRSNRSAELQPGTAEVSALMWCPVCRCQVEMVTPEQAAQIAGVSTRTVYRWIEAGTVHFIEGRGHPLICVAGLSSHRAERMPKRTNSS